MAKIKGISELARGTKRAQAAGYAQGMKSHTMSNLSQAGRDDVLGAMGRGSMYGAGIGAGVGGTNAALSGDSFWGGAVKGGFYGAAAGGGGALSAKALGVNSMRGEGGIRQGMNNAHNMAKTRSKQVADAYNTDNVSKDVFNLQRLTSALSSNPVG